MIHSYHTEVWPGDDLYSVASTESCPGGVGMNAFGKSSLSTGNMRDVVMSLSLPNSTSYFTQLHTDPLLYKMQNGCYG